MGEVRIGTSGWRYPPWRGVFYPKGLPQRRELEYLSRQVNTVELNGSFYSLQRPESFLQWHDETPQDFVFAVKGGRFITHMKRLRDVRTPLANFFASGVLALRRKLGPILWQLPANFAFDEGLLGAFLDMLPRSTSAAARLATEHDHRLDGRAYLETDADRPLRHALEARHASFSGDACTRLLREQQVALVTADSAGAYPVFDEVTADFVYARLHGDKEIYVSGYTEAALRAWARKVRNWSKHGDVFVYFDNDVKVAAPADAMTLAGLLNR